MYTVIIMALCVVSLALVTVDQRLYRSKPFAFWLLISCTVGWIEFICFLRHDAWVFDPEHITGFRILGVTIEDYLFCPCFSVIFYKLYYVMRKRFFQRVYNPTDKLLFAVVVFGIAIAYYDMGSQFAKYMSLRTAIGFAGMLYCWNEVSFRHSMVFLIIVYCIGFGWDLPSVSIGVWTYIAGNQIPAIYDGLHLTIGNAKFPIELFGYYFTGGFFSFWVISFVNLYFARSRLNR